MKKEIRITDEKRGIVQITVADERWYMREARDPQTKLPIFKAVPSVTWIAGHYPKGIAFMKWLAEQGWDEAQAIKRAAGDKGSKVHEAISAIFNGVEVRIDSKFVNRTNGREEELTPEEIECISSFLAWRSTLESFEPVAWDLTVFSDFHDYAGSVDLIARVNGILYVIDFKTSQQVYSEYELQVSAYRTAIENGENIIYERNDNGTEGKVLDVSGLKTAILQIGYKANQAGYKWSETDDKFSLFLAAKQIWLNEREGERKVPGISKKDYPIILSPGKTAESFDFGDDTEIVEVEGEIEAPIVEEKKKKPKKIPAKIK